ncbi:MAG: helix-turn-helix domain-containing protein [Gaiellaceae bacterium]
MAREKSTHVDDPVKVGERLKEAREAAGLTQRALSFPGCTSAYISRIENGARVPSFQLLREFATRLDVSADYLATGVSAPPPLSELEEAELLLRLGQHKEAEEIFTRWASKERHRGQALAGLGSLAYHEGDLERAADFLSEARELLGERWRLHPSTVETLIRTLAASGRLEEAVAAATAALASTTDEEPVARERFQVLLANALIDGGAYGRAIEILGDALGRAHEQGSEPIRLAQLLWTQSRLHAARGEHDLAGDYARRAVAVVDLTEFAAYSARARQVVAYIENERGDPDAAILALDEGWSAMEQSSDTNLKVIYIIERARALAAKGQIDDARELAVNALETTAGLGPIDRARALTTVGDVLALSGAEDIALRVFSEAAADLEQIGSPMARDVLTKWADLLERLGRRDEGFDILKRALAPTRTARESSQQRRVP